MKQLDEIYSAFWKEDNEDLYEIDIDSILESIESMFANLQNIDKQNLLSELSSRLFNYPQCSLLFHRVMKLCKYMYNTSSTANQAVALISQTKLYSAAPIDTPGFHSFISQIISISCDSKKLPYIRTVASNCLFELYQSRQDAFTIVESDAKKDNKNSQVYPIQKSLLYNIFSLSQSISVLTNFLLQIDPESEQVNQYIKENLYYMNQFERYNYARHENYADDTAPNDPILLLNSLENEHISDKQMLSIVENPFSNIGLSTVIEECGGKEGINENELISSVDKPTEFIRKGLLSKPSFNSLNLKCFEGFTEKDPDSTLVDTVFKFAERFPPSDIILFYRHYYPHTPQFDNRWILLFHSLAQDLQYVIHAYVSQFPEREATAQISLLCGSIYPSVLSVSSSHSLLQEAARRPGTISGIFAESRGASPEEPPAPLLRPKNQDGVLSIIESSVRTAAGITIVSLRIVAAVYLQAPLVGVEISLSAPELFEHPGVAFLDSFNGHAQVTVEMQARGAGNAMLRTSATYLTVDGELESTTMQSVPVTAVQLLSPSADDFLMGLAAQFESRIMLQMRLTVFEQLIEHTVFASDVNGDGEVQSLASTPDGQAVALIATAVGQTTAVAIKAPSMLLLTAIDSFLRTLQSSR